MEGNARLAVTQPIVGELEGAKTGTMPGEAEFQATARVDQSCHQIHELLDNGFQTASFSAMAHRAEVADSRYLAILAQ